MMIDKQKALSEVKVEELKLHFNSDIKPLTRNSSITKKESASHKNQGLQKSSAKKYDQAAHSSNAFSKSTMDDEMYQIEQSQNKSQYQKRESKASSQNAIHKKIVLIGNTAVGHQRVLASKCVEQWASRYVICADRYLGPFTRTEKIT
ncbi:UNKNOWN [Stylonychia lemnae]|uniref:Uncharacterized protein n=1 Tax=Stylonychia lemnae TaxID=5949 RepID=A0A078AP30_STYLE|nr:UNKNOWN [Stylonychia lemnae]|eukprot:CDW83077.1 UNKNOWN [Stylonychia lemnae]